MPIQQKLPPPVLLFSDFAGWDIYLRKKADLKVVNIDDPKRIKIRKISTKIGITLLKSGKSGYPDSVTS